MNETLRSLLAILSYFKSSMWSIDSRQDSHTDVCYIRTRSTNKSKHFVKDVYIMYY